MEYKKKEGGRGLVAQNQPCVDQWCRSKQKKNWKTSWEHNATDAARLLEQATDWWNTSHKNGAKHRGAMFTLFSTGWVWLTDRFNICVTILSLMVSPSTLYWKFRRARVFDPSPAFARHTRLGRMVLPPHKALRVSLYCFVPPYQLWRVRLAYVCLGNPRLMCRKYT